MATYILFEGFRMDARTRDMIVEARRICVAPLFITQGGFNAGGVAASAGTHDGGGALDIRARNLTKAQIAEAVQRLRQVGFAAWHRTPDQGNWVEHIHCIAVGCPSLSRGAANQVTAYHNGRNGLANNRADDGPRLYAKNTWESYKASMVKAGTPVGGPVSGGAAGPVVDMNIVASSVRYAANGGYFRSGQAEALKDAQAVAAWGRRLGAVTPHDISVWDQFRAAENWAGAGAQYKGIIKKIQAHFPDLTVDGVFGPKTAAKMQHDRYTVIL